MGFSSSDSSKLLVHPNATLDSSKPPVLPNATLDYPSHRFTLMLPWTIQATDSPQCFLGLIQATDPFQLDSIVYVCNVVFTSVLIH
jgi:hypothetical protein